MAFFVATHVYFNVFSLEGAAFTDFHIYHEALGRAARGETVYDLNSPMPFLYPPFFLIVLWPMGWLSEPVAMTVWLHLQSLFLVVSLAALVGVSRPFCSSLVAWAIILFTGFSPVMLNNLYGQTNLLYLAVLSIFVWAYLRACLTIAFSSRPPRPCAGGTKDWQLLADSAPFSSLSPPPAPTVHRWCGRRGEGQVMRRVPGSQQSYLPPAQGRWGDRSKRILRHALRSCGTGILPVKRDRLTTCPTESLQTSETPTLPARHHGQDAHATAWEIVAALALSVAISIRILPAALLALAIIQRRYRMALWTIGFVAAETLAAGALAGFATEWNYFTSYIFRLHGLENMREISLLALGRRIAPTPPVGAIMFIAIVAAGVTIFFALVFGPMRRLAPSPLLHIAFVIASMVLFAPLLEYHHYPLLLAPYVLILADLTRRKRLCLTSALPVFLSWAVVSGANQLSHYQFGAIAFAALAGAALIWAYGIWLIVEDRFRPATQSQNSQNMPEI